MPAPSVAGLDPEAAHQVVVTALGGLNDLAFSLLGSVGTGLADTSGRLRIVLRHYPVIRPTDGVGVALCHSCSVGESRVGWPCADYVDAAGPVVTGLLIVVVNV